MRALAVSGLLGGEWAGWACAFGAGGALRRVPDRYLSDTALEWGQIPAGFEELTTESVEGATLCRRSARLLPEDGCAVDDLSAEVARTEHALAAERIAEGDGCAALALDTRRSDGRRAPPDWLSGSLNAGR